MQNFEIITIGNELLIGITENTNSTWLCRQISNLGGKINRITVIRDKKDEIAEAIDNAFRRKPSWIITTGGLGPTHDDQTLEGLALFDDEQLVVNLEAIDMVKESYRRKKINVELTEARLKMATIPANSKPIPNPIGNAPAVLLTKNNIRIMCLPGVPDEMKAICHMSLFKDIEKEIVNIISEARYDVYRVGEAMLASFLSKLSENYQENAYIKTHPKGYINGNVSHIIIHIIINGKDIKSVEETLKVISEEIIQEIKRLGGSIIKAN